MTKIEDGIKRVGGAAGTVMTVYQLAVQVEGKPIQDRTKPATVRVFGLAIFTRDENLDRRWFGVIKRGKSRVAKRYLASQPPADPDIQLPDKPNV